MDWNHQLDWNVSLDDLNVFNICLFNSHALWIDPTPMQENTLAQELHIALPTALEVLRTMVDIFLCDWQCLSHCIARRGYSDPEIIWSKTLSHWKANRRLPNLAKAVGSSVSFCIVNWQFINRARFFFLSRASLCPVWSWPWLRARSLTRSSSCIAAGNQLASWKATIASSGCWAGGKNATLQVQVCGIF